MDIAVAVILFVLGAVMGSFACCQAWRLRLREKKKKNASEKWSECLSCGERLKWYDNIPVVSWLVLGGKCRKCGKKIGWWEFLSEVGLGLVFVIFGMSWWLGFDPSFGEGETIRYVLQAGIFMVMLVGLMILFIYDARWGRLPMRVLTFCIICAIMYVAIREWGVFSVGDIWRYLGALAVLPGLYFLMYKISKERWVGGGDWILALPLALALGDFWLGFFCLFIANLLGCLVMVPMMRVQKKDTNMRVPFGPFLIIAFMVVFLAQEWILALVNI